MTIDVYAFSGKPLAAVIDELCMAVAPGWQRRLREIVISKHQRITLGDPEQVSRGILVIGAQQTPEEMQIGMDAAACSRVLQPLFNAFSEGRLIVFGHEIPAGPRSAGVPISSFTMGEPWELHFSDRLTLATLDDEGKVTAKYRLIRLDAPTTADEAVNRIRREAENAKPRSRNQGGAPPEYDWPMAETALMKYFEEEGTPGSLRGEQAKAEKFLQDWFSKKGGKIPSESLIRDHVKAVASRVDQVMREGR